MQRVDTILSELLFGLLALIAIGSTWLFGAWENWWFWPFVTLIFTTGACFALRLILSAELGTSRLGVSSSTFSLFTVWLPFLLYALIRSIQTDVPMDAERSFLLQFTPILLGIIALAGIPEQRQRLLASLLLLNLALIGIYGIANHLLADNTHVLWVTGYPQYQEGYHRATGTYFCPDHFSGLMEIVLALGLALSLVKNTTSLQKLAGASLSAIALCGIILSRSRGGGIVAGLVVISALWLCTMSWDKRARWLVRGGGLIFLLAGIIAFTAFGGHYVKRFKEYPWSQLEHSDRFQMSAAALRGWQSAPWFGIGPGMHQNLWPHFAASRDGDPVKGIWPTHPNNTYHSFEAHDDWAQMLEEYGIAGVALFLVAIGSTLWLIFRRWRRCACLLSQETGRVYDRYPWILPGLLLAFLAMAIHSFGDFNLQIPGTVWNLGILAGLTIAISRHTQPNSHSHRTGTRAAE